MKFVYKICFVACLVFATGSVFWVSPYSIGFKIRFLGPSSSIALDTANQILRQRGTDRHAVREAIDLKLKVARGELRDAASALDELLLHEPDNVNILIMRAGVYVNEGDLAAAMEMLVHARRRIVDNVPSSEFRPGIDAIDTMISDIKGRRER